ncbi:MAG TPA: hypothetical protein VF994_14275 [Myxococcales bacterium]
MVAGALTDALRDLWGPGLVFLALCGWLVRRAFRAARNESILEEQRLRDAFGKVGMGDDTTSTSTSTSTSAPTPTPAPPSPVRVPPQLFRADVRGALQEHLDVVARLQAEREAATGGTRPDVLWVRSNPTHVAWAELRPGNREVICVAQIDDGAVVARWQFG